MILSCRKLSGCQLFRRKCRRGTEWWKEEAGSEGKGSKEGRGGRKWRRSSLTIQFWHRAYWVSWPLQLPNVPVYRRFQKKKKTDWNDAIFSRTSQKEFNVSHRWPRQWCKLILCQEIEPLKANNADSHDADIWFKYTRTITLRKVKMNMDPVAPCLWKTISFFYQRN